MNKALNIIEDTKDIEMFQEVLDFLGRTNTGMTSIQIEDFVLNDIEFPTDYGKLQQTKLELRQRYFNLVDLYYQIKEIEIKIEIKQENKIKEANELKKKLLDLQIEKLQLQLVQSKSEIKRITSEARIFFKTYKKNERFEKLSPEEQFELEAENWAKKALNTPTIFEERYGEKYMRKALGDKNYEKYLELRRQGFGLLPREIFEIKQLSPKK